MGRLTSAAILLAALTASTGHAADVIWVGRGTGTWSTTTNWHTGAVPGANDNVLFKGWAPLSRAGWTMNSSTAEYMTFYRSNMKDGRESTRWSSGGPQVSGNYITVDMGSAQTFAGISMSTQIATDYARTFDVYVSNDGMNWGTAIASGTGSSARVETKFSEQTFQHIKIQLTSGVSNWWNIGELLVWGTGGATKLYVAGATVTGTGPLAGTSLAGAIDGDYTTRWAPAATQVSGQNFCIDLGSTQTVSGLILDAYSGTNQYPANYSIQVGTGCGLGTVLTSGAPSVEYLHVTFTATAGRYVTITQTTTDSDPWSIYELSVLGTPANVSTPSSQALTAIKQNNGVTFTQASGHTITLTDDWTQSAGTFTGSNTGTESNTIDIGGDFSLSGTGAFTSTRGRLEVGGAFSISGASSSFTHNSGQVMLNSTAASQTFATNGKSFFDLTVNDGLVGYWKLDEGTTPILDSSGYGNSGTLAGSPTWAAGPTTLNFTSSNAMVVNGTNQYATLGNPAVLNFTGEITMAAWVKIAATSGTERNIVTHGHDGSSEVFLRINAGSYQVGSYSNPNNYVTSYAIPGGDVGAWVHVAGLYDGTSWRLYRNGVQVSSSVAATGAVTVTNQWAIGARYTGTERFFQGTIDDVRIYKRALTLTEISALAAGNQPGSSVATHNMTGVPTVTNDLRLASGTLSVGSNNLSVDGSWNNYGGIFTAGSGTVTLTSAASIDKIRSAGQPFNNLILNSGTPTASNWTLEDWLKVNSALTVTAGSLIAGPYAIHASNLSKTSGTFNAGTGTVVIDTTANVTQSTGFTFNNLRIETPDETNLVGYWKLDEGQGTSTSDATGNGSHGTLSSNGETSWIASSLPSFGIDNHGAASFNGTSSYVSLGSPAILNFNGQITMAAWVKTTSTSGIRNIVAHGYNAAGNSEVFLRIDSNVYQAGSFVSAITYQTTYSVPGGDLNTWVHLVGVHDGAAWRLYRNGVAVGSPSVTVNGAITIASTPWAIGARGDGTSRWFSGDIDDVRIYNTGLTADQVANLYARGYAGTGSGATVTLGSNLTVNGTLAIDNGTLATSTYTINAAATDSTKVASVNAGTLAVGSNTLTFNGGLTVSKEATVTENTVGGSIALGTGKELSYTHSGSIQGFPTAAFNWNDFTFWREYVAYSSFVSGGTTADTVLALTANGGEKYAWSLPAGHGSLLGTPRWNMEGANHYIYLITTTGYVFKVQDTGSALTTVAGGIWPYRNGAMATATTPLANDANNLYWSGKDGSGNLKMFSLTLAGGLNGTPLTVGAGMTAAPALATISGTNYVFFAIANKVFQETLNLGSEYFSTQPTTAVNGRLAVWNSIVYFPENGGKVWALNATNTAGPTQRWWYQDRTANHNAACTGGSFVCPPVNNIYVDVRENRTAFGDQDGHIYVLNSSGTPLTGFPWQISGADSFQVAPVLISGVLMIGTTGGKVYEIDVNNGTTRALTRTYTLPAAVSSISFNLAANAGNGAYTVGTSDGRLYYLNAATDPTAGST